MTKICTKCGIEYPRTKEYFYSDKRTKDGLQSECKKCHCANNAGWRKKNLEKCNGYSKKHYQQNKEKVKEYQKKYRKSFRGYVARLIKAIKQRCNNPKATGYKDYGGCGIKCMFNSDELYDWLITNNIDPRGLEIHRINNNGNYTLGNIVFLSGKEHRQLHKRRQNGKRK